jgi:hypothetical protein
MHLKAIVARKFVSHDHCQSVWQGETGGGGALEDTGVYIHIILFYEIHKIYPAQHLVVRTPSELS